MQNEKRREEGKREAPKALPLANMLKGGHSPPGEPHAQTSLGVAQWDTNLFLATKWRQRLAGGEQSEPPEPGAPPT